ncbi:patatin-like phospholipase family protein [Planctobacterium marinum]|uniref:PNPLA domain-containing protein n=1 Tax=Planctobacterium marinum TaxID=1631968 RepID=A0AA48HJ95_9ALTE|nr:hypothetical protein MACH26_18150 [Planctobacterium marinum]
MKTVLNVYAGPRAMQMLKVYGFNPDLFHTVLGASGGPKWFVLAGIDRVLISEFFRDRQQPLNMVGSSAGAFRFACLTQPDPVSAINRLAKEYSETVYSDKPTIDEISDKAVALLENMLPRENRQHVVDNPIFVAHLIAARCRGLLAPERKSIQYPGLLVSAVANGLSRRYLDKFYERFVFSGNQQPLSFEDPAGLHTQHVKLTENNIIDALLASGAIPGVLRGIPDIEGAGKGMFRDGGVTDYHFDLQFKSTARPDEQNTAAHQQVNNDLVLFPHFFAVPKPGWFDKSLPWRHPHRSSYDNVVMVVPSDEFVASLPFGKIPDRHDFTKIPVNERLQYWKTVLSETDRLGEAFMALQNPAQLQSVLQPLPFKLS